MPRVAAVHSQPTRRPGSRLSTVDRFWSLALATPDPSQDDAGGRGGISRDRINGRRYGERDDPMWLWLYAAIHFRWRTWPRRRWTRTARPSARSAAPPGASNTVTAPALVSQRQGLPGEPFKQAEQEAHLPEVLHQPEITGTSNRCGRPARVRSPAPRRFTCPTTPPVGRPVDLDCPRGDSKRLCCISEGGAGSCRLAE